MPRPSIHTWRRAKRLADVAFGLALLGLAASLVVSGPTTVEIDEATQVQQRRLKRLVDARAEVHELERQVPVGHVLVGIAKVDYADVLRATGDVEGADKWQAEGVAEYRAHHPLFR